MALVSNMAHEQAHKQAYKQAYKHQSLLFNARAAASHRRAPDTSGCIRDSGAAVDVRCVAVCWQEVVIVPSRQSDAVLNKKKYDGFQFLVAIIF